MNTEIKNRNQRNQISVKKTVFSVLQFAFYRNREEGSYGGRCVASVISVLDDRLTRLASFGAHSARG